MYISFKNNKGVTLIENLFSAVILALVMGAVVGVFVVGKMNIVKAQNRTKAINLLRDKMEEIKGLSYEDVEFDYYGTSVPEDDVDDVTGTDNLINDTRTTSATKDANGNLIVTITLNWEKVGWGTSASKGTSNDPDEKLVTLISE
jgi:Tfp pilus assembly protein PilV